MWPPKYYESPDNVIKKEVYEPGVFGSKPTENSVCTVGFNEIKCEQEYESEYLESLGEKKITIGDASRAIDRQIDNCLMTMCKGEISRVNIQLKDVQISFEIKLIDFESNGYYYEWTAEQKCKMALHHKEKGIDLFKCGRYVDASHRFSRGLKLLLSIPIPVDDVPEEVDRIKFKDIQNSRSNLYNNLASCYAKGDMHDTVIELCTKVLELDEDNCKALYKRGFAYSGNQDYERAKVDLEKVLKLDANNKAVVDKLNYINSNIIKQETNYTNMVRKMFK